MLSNTSDRSGFRMDKSALKLRKRQESAARQNQACDEVLDDHRAITAEESHESEIWIDDHFQRVLKNLVHSHRLQISFMVYKSVDRDLNLPRETGRCPMV